ncbi:hypothetical protein B0H10DRAFT_545609 [Mycena sp. CBHHK59/15]|nr:hypothetical protein B0H10DRAFT_545609 [Mycena sp. CBHHK59/15]
MVAAPVLAFAFGSYGDITEAIKQAKAIIDILRGVRKGSKERQAISLELASVVATAEQLLKHLDKFPTPSPEYTELLNKLASDIVPFGCNILKEVRDGIQWWNDASIFQRLKAAVSEKEELDKWRHYIDRFRSDLTGLASILTLICSVGQIAQLRDQSTSQTSKITRHLTSQMSAITRLADAQLPREISPNFFYILDPSGVGAIPFSLQHFRGFDAIHKSLADNIGADTAASQYILRGDYSLVAETDAIVLPQELGREVGVNKVFRISIIKRRMVFSRSAVHTCSKCGTKTPATEGIWTQW